MRIYAVLGVAALTLIAGSCADAPTGPRPAPVVPDQSPLMKRAPGGHGRADALSDVPVTMPARFPSGEQAVFTGFFTASRVEVVTDGTTGKRQLKVFGTLTGKVTRQDRTEVGIPATEVSGIVRRADGGGSKSAFRPTQASCDILFLDLGPIHLDLLGLVLDVSEIVIDLNGVTGGGNLLGNLLCALLGLLDIPGLLGAISNLLDLINAILNNLSGAGTPLV